MEHQENWKPVIDFEGLYEVSDLGRIKSIGYRKVKILSLIIDKYGYHKCTLCKNSKKYNKTIHRLVWESFNGKTNLQVDHIVEGNKLDNRLCNLQVLTNKENVIKCVTNKKTLSKYLYVSQKKSSLKFYYYYKINGVQKSVGGFLTEEEAHNAYQNYLKNVLRTS